MAIVYIHTLVYPLFYIATIVIKKGMTYVDVLLLLCTCLLCTVESTPGVDSITIANCPAAVIPVDPNAPAAASLAVQVKIRVDELARVYSQVFRMSDGSVLPFLDDETGKYDMASAHFIQRAVEYLKVVISPTGVVMQNEVVDGQEMLELTICSNRLSRLILMAVVGNFVSNPSSDVVSEEQYDDAIRVVVNPRTGQMEFVSQYNITKMYMLQALLVICLIVIVRLSVVRNVTVVMPLRNVPSEISQVHQQQPVIARVGLAHTLSLHGSNNNHSGVFASPVSEEFTHNASNADNVRLRNVVRM